MQLFSRILLIVCTTSLLCSVVWGGCTPRSRTVTHTIDASCTINLGTGYYCKSSGSDGCQSKQTTGALADNTNAKSLRKIRHCVLATHNVISGTKTQADIRAHSGCSSYNDGTISYKFANATSCSCKGALLGVS